MTEPAMGLSSHATRPEQIPEVSIGTSVLPGTSSLSHHYMQRNPVHVKSNSSSSSAKNKSEQGLRKKPQISMEGSGVISSSGTSGVVVVGVIGKVAQDVSQLLDRLLNSHAFNVQNRDWKRWGGSFEYDIPSVSSTSLSATTAERNRGEDGYKIGTSEQNEEDADLERSGRLKDPVGCDANDIWANRRNKSEKGSGRIGQHERRKEGNLDDARSGNGNVMIGGLKSKNVGIVGDNFGDTKKTSDGSVEAHKDAHFSPNKLKYFHDVEKGMVYVQFVCGELPFDFLKWESLKVSVDGDKWFSCLKHHEADDMRGLLFMFSTQMIQDTEADGLAYLLEPSKPRNDFVVCHVILIVQEGACFDPQYLQVFRLLQTAKQSLTPFVKTQVLPGLLPQPSSTSKPCQSNQAALAASNNSGRTGLAGRNPSTIALMSGSTPVLFPGQCIPVLLFVCIVDMVEPAVSLSSHTTGPEDVPEVSISSVVQSGSLSSSQNYRQMLHVKPLITGSCGVRNKLESGLRKKLQSSMEAQIRFLLKKCRTVVGLGDSGPLGVGGTGTGSRGPGVGGNTFQGMGAGVGLFVLDPSRAVILLDRWGNWQTAALDAAVDSIEAMSASKEISNDALWDIGSKGGMPGDGVHAINDFLWRQTEMLRGKGGISSNSVGGSAGVGIVAAAAAAAAASAASGGSSGLGKSICNPPELPPISCWRLACTVLAEVLSVNLAEEGERDSVHRSSNGTRIAALRGVSGLTTLAESSGSVLRSKFTVYSTILSLENGSDVELKFSSAWCQRVLTAAHDAYLKGLPPSYPTSFHKSQVDKALRVFHSMVRGPAVSRYSEWLRRECDAVWHSGRQLCDAESLTGKPCIYQVHKVVDTMNVRKRRLKNNNQDFIEGEEKRVFKPHSSGVVFLHACACGRSRKLRKDPFDFESANVSFFKFPNCEDLLPSLMIPSSSGAQPSGECAWSLVCLGNACYYQPAVGLTQSGFCPKQNFLSPWDIHLVYHNANSRTRIVASMPKKEVIDKVLWDGSKVSAESSIVTTLCPKARYVQDTNHSGMKLHHNIGWPHSDATGSPVVCDMFGSSVAWMASMPLVMKENMGNDAASPQEHEKPSEQKLVRERMDFLQNRSDHEVRTNAFVTPIAEQSADRLGTFLETEGCHVNTVESPPGSSSRPTKNCVTEDVRMYIGFEHECPHGHRFLLSHQRQTLGSFDSIRVAGVGHQDTGSVQSPKYKNHYQNDSNASDSVSLTPIEVSNLSVQESKRKIAGSPSVIPSLSFSTDSKLSEGRQSWSVQDGQGDGHSLLNSNLPIYMHCPYCKKSEEQKKRKTKGVVFGGTISQLQRIFLVTPSLPVVLASRPVVQFEDASKQGRSIVEFNPGREVVLPPDSFMSLQLPFVYRSKLDGAPSKSFRVQQSQPEHCAWLVKNTAIYIQSKAGINNQSGGKV